MSVEESLRIVTWNCCGSPSLRTVESAQKQFREKQDGVPTGEVEVEVDAETFLFRFVKVAVNVATRPGETENLLPEILTRMFGEKAAASGTRQFVLFEETATGWRLRKA